MTKVKLFQCDNIVYFLKKEDQKKVIEITSTASTKRWVAFQIKARDKLNLISDMESFHASCQVNVALLLE